MSCSNSMMRQQTIRDLRCAMKAVYDAFMSGEENWVKITIDNVHESIGRAIKFNTRSGSILAVVTGASSSGKTIYTDYAKNPTLVVEPRKLYMNVPFDEGERKEERRREYEELLDSLIEDTEAVKVVKPRTLIAKDIRQGAQTRKKSMLVKKQAHSSFKRSLKKKLSVLKKEWMMEARAKKQADKASKAIEKEMIRRKKFNEKFPEKR